MPGAKCEDYGVGYLCKTHCPANCYRSYTCRPNTLYCDQFRNGLLLACSCKTPTIAAVAATKAAPNSAAAVAAAPALPTAHAHRRGPPV